MTIFFLGDRSDRETAQETENVGSDILIHTAVLEASGKRRNSYPYLLSRTGLAVSV